MTLDVGSVKFRSMISTHEKRVLTIRDYMDLTERKLKILQAIVSDFIGTAEPVGSRTLSKKDDLNISSATIRNEMADLEEMGYLAQPHTSAGRVPTDKAYRLYVNRLMQKYEIPEDEKKLIERELSSDIIELDKTIKHASELLSKITNLTSFAMTPRQDTNKIKQINFLPVDEYTVVLMITTENEKIKNMALKMNTECPQEHLDILSKTMTYNYRGKTINDALTLDIVKSFESDVESLSRLSTSIMPSFLRTLEEMLNVELYMDGMANIFNIPEYNNIDRARVFLEMINDKKDFTELLVNREDGVIITIGSENSSEVVPDSSLITATYHINGKLVGKLGVVGPTRMNYEKITSVIEYMTQNLDNTFKLTEGDKDD